MPVACSPCAPRSMAAGCASKSKTREARGPGPHPAASSTGTVYTSSASLPVPGESRVTVTPAGPSGLRLPMTPRFDDQEHRAAARMERDYPGWAVLWGAHTRLFWAFPRFQAPPGTIVAAPDTADLITRMQHAELT